MQATLGPNVTNLQTQRFAFSFVSPNGKQPATLKKGGTGSPVNCSEVGAPCQASGSRSRDVVLYKRRVSLAPTGAGHRLVEHDNAVLDVSLVCHVDGSANIIAVWAGHEGRNRD